MALRNVVGTAARMTADFWKEVAQAADPQGSGAAADDPEPTEPHKPGPDVDGQADDVAEAAPATVLEAMETHSPDGVLVPLDAWTRVMEQLGHLHEAGQELADARERAARAETKVEFLREQLAAERSGTKSTRPTKPKADADADAEPDPPAESADPPHRTIDLTAGRERVVAAGRRLSSLVARTRQR